MVAGHPVLPHCKARRSENAKAGRSPNTMRLGNSRPGPRSLPGATILDGVALPDGVATLDGVLPVRHYCPVKRFLPDKKHFPVTISRAYILPLMKMVSAREQL